MSHVSLKGPTTGAKLAVRWHPQRVRNSTVVKQVRLHVVIAIAKLEFTCCTMHNPRLFCFISVNLTFFTDFLLGHTYCHAYLLQHS